MKNLIQMVASLTRLRTIFMCYWSGKCPKLKDTTDFLGFVGSLLWDGQDGLDGHDQAANSS